MGSTEIAEKMGRLSEAAQAENCVYEPKLKCRGCMLDIVPTRLPNVIYPGYPLTLLARVTKANAVSYPFHLHPPLTSQLCMDKFGHCWNIASPTCFAQKEGS